MILGPSYLVWFVLWHINHCSLFNATSIFIHINSSISNNLVQHKYNILISKIVLYRAIQFSISTQFSSISPIDRTLTGATTPGQSGLGSDGNEEVLCIPQSSSITGASPSDCLVSYLGHSLREVLPLCRDTVSVFCSPSQLGQCQAVLIFSILRKHQCCGKRETCCMGNCQFSILLSSHVTLHDMLSSI